jgi:hypothetical protein
MANADPTAWLEVLMETWADASHGPVPWPVSSTPRTEFRP